MDADADYGCKERIVLFSVNHEPMQTIIIENPVVDSFSSGSLVIDFRTTRYICIKADIPVGSCFYNTPVFSGGTAVFAFGGMLFSKRTPPHKITFRFIIAIRNHASPILADRSAIFINFDCVRNRLRTPTLAVEINESAYISVFKQPISRKVVHGRIKAHVFYREGGHMFFQFAESNQCINGIVPFGTGKAEKQGKICMKFTVITGEMEQCITIMSIVF